MFTCPFFWIDAFTDRAFAGNPAGVCPLPSWPDDAFLQQVAHQNGLAETAFFVRTADPQRFELRWFTPALEIDLCGHATLATAHALFRELGYTAPAITFDTRSGPLVVTRNAEDRIQLNFPNRAPTPIDVADLAPGVLAALGVAAVEWVGRSRDVLIVVPDSQTVRNARPNFDALTRIGGPALILTAPGSAPDDCDFVSRFFAPDFGVVEDPVTGSTHCTLIPYWADRLQKSQLIARQVSPRGGKLWCELQGDRVTMAGDAVTYIRGTLNV
jgi:PhzF family phenazine biosynthesis protein